MNTPNSRIVRSPRGPDMTAKTWAAEAALRMLMNNLDPEVAERPQDLVVYGGIGKAARDWAAFDRIVETLQALEADEPCWSSRASLSASSAPMPTRRAS